MKNSNIKIGFGIVAAIILGIFTQSANARTVFTSKVTTGNWSSSSSWVKTGTGSPIVYIIKAGNTITLNENASGKLDSVIINGQLIFGLGKKIEMKENGAVVVEFGGQISGGNANSKFDWEDSNTDIGGPFNGTNLIDGPQYATLATTVLGGGVPQPSFVSFLTALPVSLKSIEVDEVNSEYILSWISVDEAANTTFNVEVSTNGTDYNLAGSREISEETSTAAFSVNMGKQTKSFYTRLVHVDANGTRTILSVVFTKVAAANEMVRVFPQVLQSGAALNVVLTEAGDYKMEIFNTNGVQVKSSQLNTQTNNEVTAINSNDLGLANGWYVVVITGTNGVAAKTKIVVAQ